MYWEQALYEPMLTKALIKNNSDEPAMCPPNSLSGPGITGDSQRMTEHHDDASSSIPY
jgi:hypothetical protein